MTIDALIEQLKQCVESGVNKPTDNVVFRNERDCSALYLGVDYVLTAARPNQCTLCHDNGCY